MRFLAKLEMEVWLRVTIVCRQREWETALLVACVCLACMVSSGIKVKRGGRGIEGLWFLVSKPAESAVGSSAPHHIGNSWNSDVDPVICRQTLSLSQPSALREEIIHRDMETFLRWFPWLKLRVKQKGLPKPEQRDRLGMIWFHQVMLPGYFYHQFSNKLNYELTVNVYVGWLWLPQKLFYTCWQVRVKKHPKMLMQTDCLHTRAASASADWMLPSKVFQIWGKHRAGYDLYGCLPAFLYS